MNPLFLCYDTSRIPQAIDLAKRCKQAKRPCIIVLNPNSGWFGTPASLKPWSATITTLHQHSARVFGYIDLLDDNSKLKDYNTLCSELTSWAHTGVTEIFLDDARASHKGILLKLTQKFPGHQFLANPGTYTPSLRGIPHVALIEQEDNTEKVKVLSRISIFFVHKENLKSLQANAASLSYAAFEPYDTYHVPKVEYQRPNPFLSSLLP